MKFRLGNEWSIYAWKTLNSGIQNKTKHHVQKFIIVREVLEAICTIMDICHHTIKSTCGMNNWIVYLEYLAKQNPDEKKTKSRDCFRVAIATSSANQQTSIVIDALSTNKSQGLSYDAIEFLAFLIIHTRAESQNFLRTQSQCSQFEGWINTSWSEFFSFHPAVKFIYGS